MKFKFLATAAAALLFPIAVWAVPVAVSMTPSQNAVNQGGTITVNMRIDGLLAAMDQLSAYDIRVNYDSTLLTLTGHSFLADAPLGSPYETFDDSTAGLHIDQVVSFITDPADLVSAQAGLDGFNLFSLTFMTANTDAVTNLSFAMVPKYTKVLGNNDGNDLDATYTGACVGIGAGVCGQVNPVPEPETYSLMALGLLVAGAYGRRAKRRAKAAVATV